MVGNYGNWIRHRAECVELKEIKVVPHAWSETIETGPETGQSALNFQGIKLVPHLCLKTMATEPETGQSALNYREIS